MKRIGALFLIVMSLQIFGEQYRTLKEANANITLSEIGSSNGKIERAIKKGYSQENFLKILEKEMSSEETYNKDSIEKMSLIGMTLATIKYAKVNIEQIKYLSDNQAEVTLNIVIPSIEKMDGKKYEERLSEAFKKKVGYSVEEIKNRDLTKSEIEKLIPVYMKITGEEIEKINHFTSLNETVKVNKNSNSQWEIEKLGLF